MTKELRDQSAHFLAALAVIALASGLGASIGLAGGALIGFALGLVREITEEGEVSLPALNHALHSWRDLTFWTLGGATAGGLL